MSSRATPEALGRLLDREAIAAVLYRYCRGCDRADEATLRACFHADAKLRHGGFDGSASDFCGLAMKIVGALVASKHMLGNLLIEFAGEGAGTATCESHYLAYHRRRSRSGEEQDVFQGGRYLDRLAWRDGEWRIAQRVGLIDFERCLSPADHGLQSLAAEDRSRKYPDDPLYRFITPGGEGR